MSFSGTDCSEGAGEAFDTSTVFVCVCFALYNKSRENGVVGVDKETKPSFLVTFIFKSQQRRTFVVSQDAKTR